ncbi:hypothetical protein PLESTB_001506900 [Pleodorina starrii]|uniref:SRCR domain-containing protein n=1 Tax=Pleodorina starrii TaxID=330485 RepID=A0A9W6BWL8_9CHLO|nr:hypothetical protein PLESTB_001506900 [Pleodorina starrii]
MLSLVSPSSEAIAAAGRVCSLHKLRVARRCSKQYIPPPPAPPPPSPPPPSPAPLDQPPAVPGSASLSPQQPPAVPSPPSPPTPPSPSYPYACTEAGALRLVDGPNAYAGRLEVCYNACGRLLSDNKKLCGLVPAGVWGTVCNTNWDDVLSQMACRQITGSPSAYGVVMTSFSASSSFPRFQPAGGLVAKWLDPLNFRSLCYGNESRLADCVPDEAWGRVGGSCTHLFDVGLVCWPSRSVVVSTPVLTAPPYTCSNDKEVRLVNGSSPGMGRVEVCLNGQWGAVCGGGWNSTAGWNNTAAAAVCRGLGYSGGYVNNLNPTNIAGAMCLSNIDCRPRMYGDPGVNQPATAATATVSPHLSADAFTSRPAGRTPITPAAQPSAITITHSTTEFSESAQTHKAPKTTEPTFTQSTSAAQPTAATARPTPSEAAASQPTATDPAPTPLLAAFAAAAAAATKAAPTVSSASTTAAEA